MTTDTWFTDQCGYVSPVLRFILRQHRDNTIPNDDSEQAHYCIL